MYAHRCVFFSLENPNRQRMGERINEYGRRMADRRTGFSLSDSGPQMTDGGWTVDGGRWTVTIDRGRRQHSPIFPACWGYRQRKGERTFVYSLKNSLTVCSKFCQPMHSQGTMSPNRDALSVFSDTADKLCYNHAVTIPYRHLRGRVKFPTGGIAHEPTCNAGRQDPVKLRGRRYSPDGRRCESLWKAFRRAPRKHLVFGVLCSSKRGTLTRGA